MQTDTGYGGPAQTLYKRGMLMYDGHIYSREYKDLKDQIVDILNGETEDYDVEALADHIQELYEEGELQATQYDDLMRYIQDME